MVDAVETGAGRGGLRAALVLNPAARQGDRSPQEIVDCLAAHGVHAEPLMFVKDQLGAVLRQAAGGGYDAVVVGGGDGTLSAAAAELSGGPLPLGILPLGTANDFARSLAIPTDLEAACAVIGAGHTAQVDVGVANGRPFLNVTSIGLPATVVLALVPELKKRLGVLAYAVAAVRAFRHQRPFSAMITIDGRVRRVRRVMQLAVGSGRHYGGGLTLTDTAQPTDGLLHVHVITARTIWALIWTLRHLRSGHYGVRDSAVRFAGRHVRVQTRRRHRVNMDGELIGHTPLDVTVRAGALKVFVPAPE